ncbi:MAG: TRAP transporter substrate-binding protein DctP [Candidatus Dactylopiibacterium sp.]|nr:TRAP transporter substrate-binding protein DctP [Candidatus Dactylopiibacterium sp.]
MRRFLLIASVFLVSVAHAAPAAWSPQIEDHPSTLALKSFLGRAQAITGQADATLLPISAGKDQAALLESLRKGNVRAAVLTGSMVGRVAPMADVMRLPFILRNSRQMFGMLEGEVGQEMIQRLHASGLVVLGWYDGGSRAIYSRDRLGSVGALQHTKIRIPARRDLSALITSLGGTPLQLEYKDVNGAFEAGNIDAAENDLLSYEAEGHYKRARYYYLNNNHIVQFEALVVSRVWWESLPAAQREALRGAGEESARLDRAMWGERLAKARARLEKEGVKFVEYGTSSMLLSRVATIYRPYMENPATRDLIVRLMTSRT